MSDFQNGRGRGGSRSRGGRGGGQDGQGGRGRGDYQGRGRGDFRGRGRGDFQGRGRGDFQGRGRGDFRGSGDRGRGGGRGGRGGFRGGGDMGPRIHGQGDGIPAIDSRVMGIEDETAKELAVKHQKSALQSRYPERPGFGSVGQRVTLYANYFQLQSAGTDMFRYSVDVSGDSAGRKPAGKKLRQVINLLLEEHFAQYKNSVASDHKSNLISKVKLPEGQFDVRYRDEYEDDYPETPNVYRVRCQFTGTLNSADLINYLTSTNATATFQSKAEVLQAMNIVLGHLPKSDSSIISVGANKHFSVHSDTAERYDLGAGLEVLRGFFISVRASTARLLLNVQVKYAACYQQGPLGAIITEYQRGSRDIYKLDGFLKKLKVQATHLSHKSSRGRTIYRVRTIAGLASTADGKSLPHPPKVRRHGASAKDVEFFLDESGAPSSDQSGGGNKGKKQPKAGPSPAGKYVSVAQFFSTKYDINVNPNMPVVNVGTRQSPSYLPAEVCEVIAGQPARSKLSPFQTRNMLNFAVRPPAPNAQSIVDKGVKVLGLTEPSGTILATFGIQPQTSLITVPGRVLQAPRVYYKDNRAAQKAVEPMSGSWNMKAIRFATPTKLASWTWLYIGGRGAREYWNGPGALDATLQSFVAKLNEVGVAVGPPCVPGVRISLTGEDNEGQIDQAIEGLLRQGKPSLILTILYSSESAIYNSVKLACDVRRGVRNVNVLAEKFSGANDQYYANVGLKFNLKLGGMNQSLKHGDLGIISEGRTMVVGIDVTHPSPGSAGNAPSVAGIVASIDSSLGQWPAEVKIQEQRQEMVSALDSMLKSRLQLWARSNKDNLPENIIVYRDGVSEGQYDTVIDKELPLLKKACAETYPASDTAKNLPRISIIIVGKRHHTRFYPTKAEDSDRSNNTKNGTVVDRGVTEARNWDFYLQAHTAIKGTARPAHYFTAWDEIFQYQKPTSPNTNAADILEDLTHKMCYLYGRATKAVSVCPPAYYADLVCERARCYLSSYFDPSTQGTPAESVVSGAGPGLNADSRDVEIHPNVKDTMFYI